MGECKTCESNKPNVRQYDIDLLSAMAERTIKRLWIVILVLIIALIGTNGAWIWYNAQFEVVETTTTIEATQDGADVNVVGGGDVNYGAESKDNQNN